MTKPALKTFSDIKANNFHFNTKLTDFECFHIDLIFSLHTLIA